MVVDPARLTVTVAAGVTQRVLLDYLAAYPSPSGYTLPAFSWFIDQTIAGAVATATHGSSLQHGSLSSQVGHYSWLFYSILYYSVALAAGRECARLAYTSCMAATHHSLLSLNFQHTHRIDDRHAAAGGQRQPAHAAR